MTTHVTVSEAARKLGASPRDISELLYRGELRTDLCPLMSGRRLIPVEYLNQVEMALRRAGRPIQQV